MHKDAKMPARYNDSDTAGISQQLVINLWRHDVLYCDVAAAAMFLYPHQSFDQLQLASTSRAQYLQHIATACWHFVLSCNLLYSATVMFYTWQCHLNQYIDNK